MKIALATLLILFVAAPCAYAQEVDSAPQQQGTADETATTSTPATLDWTGSVYSDGAGGAYVEDHSWWGDQ